MDFQRNYEILELVAEGETRTFRARQISTGRPVLVHQLLNPTALGQGDLNSMVLRFVRKAPPESLAQVLDMVEHEDSVCIVMEDSPAFIDFRQWLESEIQKLETSPAPITNVQGPLVETKPRQPSGVEPPVETAPSPGEFTRLFHMQAQPSVSSPSLTKEKPTPPVTPAAPPAPPEGPGEFTRVFHLHEQPKTAAPPVTLEEPTLPAVTPGSPAREGSPGEFTSIFSAHGQSTPSNAPLSSEGPGSPPSSASPFASQERSSEFTRLIEPPREAGVVQKAPVVEAKPKAPSLSPPAPPAQTPGEYTRLFGGSAPVPEVHRPANLQPPPPVTVGSAQASPSLPAMPPPSRVKTPPIPPTPKMRVPPLQAASGIATPPSAPVVSEAPKAPALKIPPKGQLPPSERPPLMPLVIILGTGFLLALGLVIYFLLKH